MSIAKPNSAPRLTSSGSSYRPSYFNFSVLRHLTTPGLGQNVRFFSRDAASPDSSQELSVACSFSLAGAHAWSLPLPCLRTGVLIWSRSTRWDFESSFRSETADSSASPALSHPSVNKSYFLPAPTYTVQALFNPRRLHLLQPGPVH